MVPDDYMDNLIITGFLGDRFKGDKVTMLTAYLMQLLPVVDMQLKRVREGIKVVTAEPKTMEITLYMVNVLGDIRFYYEALYWVALAVEKAGVGCLEANPKSRLGLLYNDALKPIINNLKQGRIELSHIHFDQLIRAESAEKLAKIQKHLPDQEKLMFRLTFEKDGTGIKIAKTKLNFEEDYQKLNKLKDLLRGDK